MNELKKTAQTKKNLSKHNQYHSTNSHCTKWCDKDDPGSTEVVFKNDLFIPNSFLTWEEVSMYVSHKKKEKLWSSMKSGLMF